MEQVLLTKKIGFTDKTKTSGKRLVGLVWNYRAYVLGGVISTIIMGTLMSASALVVQRFIDKALVNGDIKMLAVYSAFIVGLFVVRWPFAFLSTYLFTYSGMKVVEQLRNECYESIQSMSFAFFEKQRTGELISRISNDTSVVQTFVTSGINEILRIPIVIITALGAAIYMSAKLTIIALVVLPAIAAVIAVAGKKMKTVSISMQEKIGDLNVVLSEILTSMHVVKYFSMEDFEMDKFRGENRATAKLTLKQSTVRAAYSPMVELLGAIGLATILFIGGRDAINGTPDFLTGKAVTPGSVLSIFFLLQQIFTNVNRINHVNLLLQHAFASADRTFAIIDMEPDIQNKPDAVEIKNVVGNIEIKNVSFEYNPGEPVIKDVSVKVDAGMVVALVGHSGSGKSTLVKLLPRFYDVTSGNILIEGVDIRNAMIDSFRKHFGIVPQDTVLFRTTIRENIRYGRIDAKEEELEEAARAAYAHDFIKEMPQGYDTMVGERGVTLSGGQRQRIAIARAILKNPKILILDEATSNVDNVSEQYIQRALEKLMQDRTTFVIAHRLTTIRNADIILVMDQGKIVERGRHDELYEKGGAYRKLYDLTLREDDEVTAI